MLKDNGTCKTLCTNSVPAEDAKFINDRIKEDYALNWLIDGLPAAEMKEDTNSGEIFFDVGFNLGNDDDNFSENPALNNHYDVYIRCDFLKVHGLTAGLKVALIQIPRTLSWSFSSRWRTCLANEVSISLFLFAI